MSKLIMLRNTLAFTAIAAAIVIGLVPTTSHAQASGVVSTKSRYGTNNVSAPVRQTSHGFEVRLPGGTWISCKRDCGQALREATVDFWQTQRERSGR